MDIETVLYTIGAFVEEASRKLIRTLKIVVYPEPANEPPGVLRKLVVGRGFTFHEAVSMLLQTLFVFYLLLGLLVVLFDCNVTLFILFSFGYLFFLRFVLLRYGRFLISEAPYRFFYLGISFISFASFLGYLLITSYIRKREYIYLYIGAISLVILVFRHYFRRKYGRDYTYGTVEEIRGDMVRVFVHDDISANVKPGYYWLPAVGDAKPGMVVKILVEDRPFRSAKPVRILEVYLSQSSQSSTEPKKETE